MNGYLWVNFIAFLFVTAYAISLFIYLIKTRMMYIKLGKKVEFERNVKERLHKIWVNVFGQKKLLKDKKSGIIHVMFFYGFILVQFGAIDFIWKGHSAGLTFAIWTTLSRVYIFSGNCHIRYFSGRFYGHFIVVILKN